MKVSTGHLGTMVEAFRKVPAEKIASCREAIRLEGKAQDIEKRLRWDLLYTTLGSRWVCDVLYAHDRSLNDAHIDTALRYVMKEIVKRSS